MTVGESSAYDIVVSSPEDIALFESGKATLLEAVAALS
jgi:hypothetical protein